MILDNNNIYVSSSKIDVSYPEEGNDTSYIAEETGMWFSQRNDLISFLLHKFPFKNDFIDIGGGNGFQVKRIKEEFPNRKVILCEPGYNGCLNANRRGCEIIYNTSFQDFPFSEYIIGGVGLFDVIEHIEDDVKFLNDLFYKIPVKSKIYINVPSFKFLWSEVDEVAGHYRRYNEEDVKRILENTDFKLIDKGYYFSFYVLPMFLLRVVPYFFGVKKGKKKIFEEEVANHKGKAGIVNSYISWRHKRNLNRLKAGKKNLFGTSMYIVLQK